MSAGRSAADNPSAISAMSTIWPIRACENLRKLGDKRSQNTQESTPPELNELSLELSLPQ